MAHLTSDQRYTISVLLKKGMSKIEIGEAIGKHRSIIYWGIDRNRDNRSGEYRSCGYANKNYIKC